MIGTRKIRWRAIGELIGHETSAISPSGLRTATAQLRGPRIMTPSRTAWPPIACAMVSEVDARATSAAGLLEAALEALDPAARVHELLLTRVEGVALRADLDVQLGRGRTRRERVAARAVNGREDVLGMDLGLHLESRIPEAVWAATLPPLTTTDGIVGLDLAREERGCRAAPAGSQASFARW